jgi:hypothetical protein
LAKETKSDEDVRNSRPNQPATPGAVEEQPSEVTN